MTWDRQRTTKGSRNCFVSEAVCVCVCTRVFVCVFACVVE